MKISTRGRYALIIMIDLAIHQNEGYISLKDISEREQISNKYLEQIISKLNKAGFLDVARGINGGYRLKKESKDYKVGDILRASEGDLAPIDCVMLGGESCSKKENCKTFDFWKGLDIVIEKYVDSKTLGDLIVK